MISPTVNFLSQNDHTFHSIDERLAREKLIRYATGHCTYRTYNTYLFHQCDSSTDHAILKIYNAVKKQFENHIMIYDQANHRILLETLKSDVLDASKVFSSISDMIMELNKPLLDQIIEANFSGSILLGVHRQCLSEENGRSEGLIASARGESLDAFLGPDAAPTVPDAVPIVSTIPDAAPTVSDVTSIGRPTTPRLSARASTSSTSSTSSTVALTKPTHLARAGIAFVDERAEIQEKIRDSENCFSQKILTSDPLYTLKTKEELEVEWTKTPNNIQYAFRNGTKPRIFIFSLTIPREPIRHYEFKATEKGFKLNTIKTVCTLKEVVSHFFILASLEF